MAIKATAGRIKALRTQLGIDQEDMGTMMGVTTNTVGSMERALRSPKVEYFDNLKDCGVNALPYIDGTSPEVFTIPEIEATTNIIRFLEENS